MRRPTWPASSPTELAFYSTVGCARATPSAAIWRSRLVAVTTRQPSHRCTSFVTPKGTPVTRFVTMTRHSSWWTTRSGDEHASSIPPFRHGSFDPSAVRVTLKDQRSDRPTVFLPKLGNRTGGFMRSDFCFLHFLPCTPNICKSKSSN